MIERLLRTEDESLLEQVAQLFRSSKDEVDEDGLTDEHYNIVKERYEEYKRGEGKSYTWEKCAKWRARARRHEHNVCLAVKPSVTYTNIVELIHSYLRSHAIRRNHN